MVKVSFLKWAKAAARIAADKKGKDIVILNVMKHTPIADYFVIVTAESSPQMRAIVDDIELQFKQEDAPAPVHREGRTSSSWAVLDYGGIIIHIMSPEARAFYTLERAWPDARKITFDK